MPDKSKRRHSPLPPAVASEEVTLADKRFVVRGIANRRGKAIEIREFANGRENMVVIALQDVDKLFNATDNVMEELEKSGESKA